MKKGILALILLAALVPSIARAAPFDGKPKILLHLTYPTTKGILCDRGHLDNCADAVVNGDLYPNGKSYFLFVEVAKGNLPSIAGLQLSIDYDGAPHSGVDVFSWTYCVDAHWATTVVPWPEPGSSNRLVWDTTGHCQTGDAAIAGYFYLAAYSPDVFQVVPWIPLNQAAVATCAAQETNLAPGDLGRVAFSSGAATPGCNPCVENCTTASPRGNPIKPQGDVPVLPTTWSSIKSLYGSETD